LEPRPNSDHDLGWNYSAQVVLDMQSDVGVDLVGMMTWYWQYMGTVMKMTDCSIYIKDRYDPQ